MGRSEEWGLEAFRRRHDRLAVATVYFGLLQGVRRTGPPSSLGPGYSHGSVLQGATGCAWTFQTSLVVVDQVHVYRLAIGEAKDDGPIPAPYRSREEMCFDTVALVNRQRASVTGHQFESGIRGCRSDQRIVSAAALHLMIGQPENEISIRSFAQS